MTAKLYGPLKPPKADVKLARPRAHSVQAVDAADLAAYNKQQTKQAKNGTKAVVPSLDTVTVVPVADAEIVAALTTSSKRKLSTKIKDAADKAAERPRLVSVTTFDIGAEGEPFPTEADFAGPKAKAALAAVEAATISNHVVSIDDKGIVWPVNNDKLFSRAEHPDTYTCATCHQVLSVNKFGTVNDRQRRTSCRACRASK